jgi:hypothetical protein
MTLDQIGQQYNTDKSSVFHNYLNLYDDRLKEIRHNKNNILEIGIFNGDSIRMFTEYFDNSKIIGFDIDDKSHLTGNERNVILVGDQADRNFLNKFEDDYFDVILDDGSHVMEHQQISIGVLFKKLKSGGIYIVEDLHTSVLEYIETKNIGRDFFGVNEDNSTIDFINGLKSKNGPNNYLSTDEYDYLKENIKSIEIIETARRASDNFSITSIIIKN